MPAVFPAALVGDGLEDLGGCLQPFSDACAKSQSASSFLACARKLSLACWYRCVVTYGSSYCFFMLANQSDSGDVAIVAAAISLPRFSGKHC